MVIVIAVVSCNCFDIAKYSQIYSSINEDWFQNTLETSSKTIDKIAILRLDGDFYDINNDKFVYLFPKVVSSRLVIIDDWCFRGCRKE